MVKVTRATLPSHTQYTARQAVGTEKLRTVSTDKDRSPPFQVAPAVRFKKLVPIDQKITPNSLQLSAG